MGLQAPALPSEERWASTVQGLGFRDCRAQKNLHAVAEPDIADGVLPWLYRNQAWKELGRVPKPETLKPSTLNPEAKNPKTLKPETLHHRTRPNLNRGIM